MADEPVPFVSLRSLTHGPPDPATALAELRRIYFGTTQRTIDHDFTHAIELLRSLPEDMREKAAVYMEGLAQMQKEWAGKKKGKTKKVGRKKSEVRSKE